MAAAFALPILVGAILGCVALRQAPELLTLSVLAVTGGALTSVVFDEMITEAHEHPTSLWEPIALTVGFALFAAISAYTGF